jgi:hypothetical protein
LFLPCSFLFCELSYFNQLPDGRVIKVGTERFQAPEALFTPVRLFLSGPVVIDLYIVQQYG